MGRSDGEREELATLRRAQLTAQRVVSTASCTAIVVRVMLMGGGGRKAPPLLALEARARPLDLGENRAVVFNWVHSL